MAVAPALNADYMDIPTVRMFKAWQKVPLINYKEEDKSFYEENLFFVDTTFFDIFSFPLIKGNPETALKNPQSVIISQNVAKKYFGDNDPIGKTLELENSLELTVTGVSQETPHNSHFKFDILIPLLNISDIFKSLGINWSWKGWYWNPVHTYMILPERYNPIQFNEELSTFVQKNFPERFRKNVTLTLQPLTDIHLQSNLYQEIEVNRDKKSIFVALSIAIFILIIASINFINLTTARSLQRAKEVGMRKVMGSNRNQLIYQFLGESVLTAIISLMISIGMIVIFFPIFESLINTKLNLEYLLTPGFVVIIILGIVLLGTLSGLYPSLALSSFNPIKAIKVGQSQGLGRKSLFRKGLVVFQFTISVILLVSAIVIYKQHQFLTGKKLGFEKEEIVMVPIWGTSIKGNKEEFKNELSRNSQVIASCAISDILGQDVPLRPFTLPHQEVAINIPGLFTDHDFVETFGVKLIEGRDFSKDYPTDKESFLINENLKELLPENKWEGEAIKWGQQDRPIIGVVDNFHFADLKQSIRPLLISFSDGFIGYIAVRVKPGDISNTISSLEKTWKLFEPDKPFVPFFLDQKLNELYTNEENTQIMVSYFSLLSIFIASLGLLGLATYSTQIRVKEIGIRKVLGASVGSIVNLLYTDFISLIIISNIIAWPLAWYFMDQWLQEFTFRISLAWWYFALAGVLALIVALVAIGYNSIRASLSNPVNSLRSE